jgi:hypothetical protein
MSEFSMRVETSNGISENPREGGSLKDSRESRMPRGTENR